MSETALAVYNRPLSAPIQTPANARLLLKTHKAEIAEIAEHMAKAAGVDIEQVVSTAITELATAEPKVQAALMACDGSSILKSVADAARYGLIFGKVLGQAYLVPRGGKCCLDVGYRGYEALIYRSGIVLAIQSGVVYEGDEYDVQIGRQPPILHRPNLTASHHQKKIVGAYVVASLAGGVSVAEPMNREDLDHIRSKSKMGDRGAYVTDTAEMLRKAPIRRIAKHLPLSPVDRALLDEIMATEDEHSGVKGEAGNGVVEGEARADDLLLRVQEPETPEMPDADTGAIPADDNRTIAHNLLRCIAANAKPRTTYGDELTLLNAKALGAIRGTAVVDYDPEEAAKAVEALRAICKERKFDIEPWIRPDGPEFKRLETSA